MKITNFYKASSCLGLINIPYHGTELNVGVEEAPDYILSDNFLSKYETKKIGAESTIKLAKEVLNKLLT